MSFSIPHHKPTQPAPAPAMAQPAAPQPAAPQPVAAQPAAPQPVAAQPAAPQPVAAQPVGPVGQVQPGGLPPAPTYPQPVQQQAATPQQQVDPAYAQLQGQMQQVMQINQNLMHQLNTSTAAPAAPATPAEPAPEFKPFEYAHTSAFTDDDKKTLGGTRDAVTRLAQDVVAQMLSPVIEQINGVSQTVFENGSKFTDLDGKISGTQKQIYSTALMTNIPNLNQIVQSPAFNQFAGQTVPMTNMTVRDMLSKAHADQDISTIQNIIGQFQATQQPGQAQQQPNVQHQTQSTANPGMFAQPMNPVQAPPMTNYMQPNTAYQQTAPAPQAGNQALIEQRYEAAKRELNANKTPEAKAAYDAAAAEMFTMQMAQTT